MKIPKVISDLWNPVEYQDIPLADITMALTSLDVRTHWIKAILSEIKDINTSIDADLLQKKETDFVEKSARRRALQFVLEQILISRRAVEGQQRHNPARGGFADSWDKRPQP